ncbi:hypothetical protein [Methylomagnum sp.]
MRALAAFVMKGRAQAVPALVGLTVLSWSFSLISLLSTAAVALPTLRKGALEGAVLMVLAAVPVAFAGWLLLGSPWQAAGYTLMLWVPVWLAAVILRESGQLPVALGSAAGLGMLMVLGVYVISDDPAGLWVEELRKFLRPLLEQPRSATEAEAMSRSLAAFAHYLTGMVAAGSVLILTLGLLIARWWQATLFNPGGFRAEFLALRLPSPAAYLWLALLAVAWTTGGGMAEIAANLAIPLFVPYLLAGFAVLHALFAGGNGFWLVGIYMAVLFVSPLIMVIALIGFSDTWINWRKRLSRA